MPTAKKTTTPKAPQDRKPKVEKEPTPLPEETPGWELMRDFSTIPVWEQTPLISLMQTLGEDGRPDDGLTDAEIDALSEEEFAAREAKLKTAGVKSFDINIIGEMAKALIPYAKDEAEFTKFVSGRGALEKTMNLAMAWVGQMGESASSES